MPSREVDAIRRFRRTVAAVGQVGRQHSNAVPTMPWGVGFAPGGWHVACFSVVDPRTNRMDTNKNDNPNPSQALSSAEYRARLLTKLNCLVAVLEVAIGKIAKSMDIPGANEERLLKIRTNLENTLAICNRAKDTLQRTASASGAAQIKKSAPKSGMTARDYVELSSIEEYLKFRKMAPIAQDDIESIDFDELTRQLTEE